MTAKTHIARAAIVAGLFGCLAASWVQAGQRATPQGPPENLAASAAPSTPAAAADADTGRQVYVDKGCFACHGLEGQGSPATGPRLGPNPIPLAAFTVYVRAPAGKMPPYTETVLSDAELVDVHAFLRARPGPVSIDSLLPARAR